MRRSVRACVCSVCACVYSACAHGCGVACWRASSPSPGSGTRAAVSVRMRACVCACKRVSLRRAWRGALLRVSLHCGDPPGAQDFDFDLGAPGSTLSPVPFDTACACVSVCDILRRKLQTRPLVVGNSCVLCTQQQTPATHAKKLRKYFKPISLFNHCKLTPTKCPTHHVVLGVTWYSMYVDVASVFPGAPHV